MNLFNCGHPTVLPKLFDLGPLAFADDLGLLDFQLLHSLVVLAGSFSCISGRPFQNADRGGSRARAGFHGLLLCTHRLLLLEILLSDLSTIARNKFIDRTG